MNLMKMNKKDKLKRNHHHLKDFKRKLKELNKNLLTEYYRIINHFLLKM